MKVITCTKGKTLYEEGCNFESWYAKDKENVMIGDYLVTRSNFEKVDTLVGINNNKDLIFTEVTLENIQEILK